MAYDATLREEEIKNKVAADCFPTFDCTRILGNVDFCVQPKDTQPTLWETESLLWAEAKNGVHHDFAPLFTQLILTVGGERTTDRHSPPPFLGAFDCEKIVFLPWHLAVDLFFRSDIDFTAKPSDHASPAFRHLLCLVEPIIKSGGVSFSFGDPDLAKFIRKNLRVGNGGTSQLQVTRNNFPFVYQRWLKDVKPSINVNWKDAKDKGIHDADFFLADLLSKNNSTLLDKLFVVLRSDHYELDRHLDPLGLLVSKRAEFKDGQSAHTAFWNKYRRPPRKEFWDFINGRRDLLMPPDIRERQGSFFTPQIWVEKAQETIAAVLGENWQDDHYVWDCAGGTGNLLAGLDPAAKYRVWISTLQQGDVDIMHERIRNGAALLDTHVFQFDFLNDDFNKLPQGLRDIIDDPEKRKKLVVFINPPYAEAASARTITGTGGNKPEVAKGTAAHSKYKPLISSAANEMFALFLIRVAREIPGCVLAQFSTLKHIQASNFKAFRRVFCASLEKAFLVPANTFDNVDGEFPIGFFVWRTGTDAGNVEVASPVATVFGRAGEPIGTKTLPNLDRYRLINDWYSQFHDMAGEWLGVMNTRGNDFQNYNYIRITSDDNHNHTNRITPHNIVQSCIYLAVRLCIAPTWLNDRDQFLWPEDTWLDDEEFQLDCLVFTLFHGQNRISCQTDVNHWIPFEENLVGAKDAYTSHFMVDFLKKPKLGSRYPVVYGGLFSASGYDGGASLAAEEAEERSGTATAGCAVAFSSNAQAVFDVGLELWKYYHAHPDAVANASFYDIRAYFQGFKPNGHMKPDSPDAKYTALISSLRSAQKSLAAKIAVKVRSYGFLK